LHECDVVLEGFRPGVMARLGLDYATLSAQNPRLVYCSLSGYGQAGPDVRRAGHDLTYLAGQGILSLLATRDGEAIIPGVLLADIAAGSYPAFMNIVLALFNSAHTFDQLSFHASGLAERVSKLSRTRCRGMCALKER
jgi:crotonobetainyl-CoA:carnitine CoA-transferase CaiB-like acyl-CoA transferase